MSTPMAATDPIFAALDPLVRDATLTPSQADRVYAAVTTAIPHTYRSSDDGRLPTTGSGSQAPWFVALATLGAGLVMAAFWVSAALSGGADFAWKTFLAMLAVVAASTATAAASHVLLAGRRVGRWMTGVFGTLAWLTLPLSVMVTWSDDVWIYLGGSAMATAGAAGYWFLRSHPAALLAAFGGLVIVIQAFSDTIDTESGLGDILTSGVALMIYGLAVAGAGWRFGCRNTTGLAGGAIAVAAMFYVMVWLGTAGAFMAGGFGESDVTLVDIRSDIRIALFLGLAVAVALVAAHAITQHVGYLIEAFTAASVLPFVGILSGRVEHPLRWAFAFGLLGAVVLAMAVWGLLRRGEPGRHPVGPAREPRTASRGTPPPSHLGSGETVSW